MPLITHLPGNRRFPPRVIPVAPPIGSNEQQSQAPEDADDVEFNPTPRDIRNVRQILTRKGSLPPEVVDIILECAEYWACTVAVADFTNERSGHVSVRGGRPPAGRPSPDLQPREDRFLFRTDPIGLSHWTAASQHLWRRESKPRLVDPEANTETEFPKAALLALADDPAPEIEHPVRKIVFDIESRDQGWTSHGGHPGTYEGSHTWFDAGLERFDSTIKCPEDCPDRGDPQYSLRNIPTCAIRPLWPPSVPVDSSTPAGPDAVPNNNPNAPPPAATGAQYLHTLQPAPDHLIQRNKLASRNFEHHHVEWSATDDVDPESPEADQLEAAGRGRATGNGAFVRSLKFGDMVTVWARARYPAWVNNVKRVEVRVYWAID